MEAVFYGTVGTSSSTDNHQTGMGLIRVVVIQIFFTFYGSLDFIFCK